MRRGSSLAAVFLKGLIFLAEFTSVAAQTIAANGNAVFTETPVATASCSIVHREGSGLVTLRGNTSQCRARYLVIFNGNIAVSTGGTAGAISAAIAVNGEALGSATATVTPAAVGDFFNATSFAYVDVPRGCCTTISVKNPSAQAIDLVNANLIVTRVC